MNFVNVFLVALIGEAIWETIKMIWQQGKVNIDKVGALLVGLLIAIFAKVDVLSIIGIPMSVPYIGYIFTGILISRGANFLHDLLGTVNSIHQKNK